MHTFALGTEARVRLELLWSRLVMPLTLSLTPMFLLEADFDLEVDELRCLEQVASGSL